MEQQHSEIDHHDGLRRQRWQMSSWADSVAAANDRSEAQKERTMSSTKGKWEWGGRLGDERRAVRAHG